VHISDQGDHLDLKYALAGIIIILVRHIRFLAVAFLLATVPEYAQFPDVE